MEKKLEREERPVLTTAVVFSLLPAVLSLFYTMGEQTVAQTLSLLFYLHLQNPNLTLKNESSPVRSQHNLVEELRLGHPNKATYKDVPVRLNSFLLKFFFFFFFKA